jgi:hypothetical protein
MTGEEQGEKQMGQSEEGGLSFKRARMDSFWCLASVIFLIVPSVRGRSESLLIVSSMSLMIASKRFSSDLALREDIASAMLPETTRCLSFSLRREPIKEVTAFGA